MPVFFEKKVTPNLRIAVWEITETEKELLQFLPPLKKEEEAFIGQISFLPRKLEWLASRILIYRQTGIYPASRYKDNGQPFLTGCTEKISISHTRGFAAIALSSGEMPGIDIEYPSPRIEKVSVRFLHQDESRYLSTGELKTRQMGLIWCLKEAVFKQSGNPGLNFKEQIITHPFFPTSDEGQIAASVILQNTQHKTVCLEYLIRPDFYLAWTV
jgi:4'-phosphopantetheinyl transferase